MVAGSRLYSLPLALEGQTTKKKGNDIMSKVKHLNVKMSITFVVPENMSLAEAKDYVAENLPSYALMEDNIVNWVDEIDFSPSFDDEE